MIEVRKKYIVQVNEGPGYSNVSFEMYHDDADGNSYLKIQVNELEELIIPYSSQYSKVFALMAQDDSPQEYIDGQSKASDMLKRIKREK